MKDFLISIFLQIITGLLIYFATYLIAEEAYLFRSLFVGALVAQTVRFIRKKK